MGARYVVCVCLCVCVWARACVSLSLTLSTRAPARVDGFSPAGGGGLGSDRRRQDGGVAAYFSRAQRPDRWVAAARWGRLNLKVG